VALLVARGWDGRGGGGQGAVLYCCASFLNAGGVRRRFLGFGGGRLRCVTIGYKSEGSPPRATRLGGVVAARRLRRWVGEEAALTIPFCVL